MAKKPPAVKSEKGMERRAFRQPSTEKEVVIECYEEIPCNPCEAACPPGAITIGAIITSLPVLHSERCTGCGLCIAACPGHVIFIFDESYSDTDGTISFAYELLPLPAVGDEVIATDREGEPLTSARVVRVGKSPKFNRTVVVTLAVPKDHLQDVRGMKTKPKGDTR